MTELQLKTLLEDAGLEPLLVEEILKVGRLREYKAGKVIVSPQNPGHEMPFVLKGLLKVMRGDEEGNEVFLYYLEGGEACAMSIACCFEEKRSAFYVIAEEDSSVLMVPMSYLDQWVIKYQSFRKFVFTSYQMRFDELLNTIDSVVFTNMGERLFKYLLDTKQATGSYVIRKTHKQIAQELHTSRVVVSRLIKQLEREGKIEQKRNQIEVL